jgi:hypothetical protein
MRKRHQTVPVETLETRTLLSGLTIVPTFAASIKHDSHATEIEAAIRAGINQIDSLFSNEITVPILFEEGSGLGTSLSGYGDITYSQWKAALAVNASDANQLLAVKSLPAKNTLNGSDDVEINYANELALGLSDSYPSSFATITLNTASCNLTRDSINPNKYDLQSVAMHEMDEVLGISSILSEAANNGDPVPKDAINPEDFFRYSSAPDGMLDFTTDADASVYFSIDGGNTDLAQFNQNINGDFNDWYSFNGGQVPQVQDAFATPGVIPYYNVEPVVLDALGYTPTHTLGTGIVTGNVFNDVNGNGVQDKGDVNLSGWTVEALQNGKVITSAQSNSLQYQLGSLADGTYTIEVLPQTGFTQIAPVSSYSVTITGNNDTVSDMNFAEMPAPVGPISGTDYRDVTGNGISDNSLLPLAGVKVSLHLDSDGNDVLDAKDKLIASTKTAADGSYSFAGLPTGKYFVSETVPAGYVRTLPAVNGFELVDLTPGSGVPDQDFENFLKPTSLGVSKISYTIGSQTFKTLRDSTGTGDSISVTFTVTHRGGEQLTFASYESASANFSAGNAAQETLFSSATGFYLPGTYSLNINVPPSGFYQIDFVVGDVITQFGPAGSNISYTLEKRLIVQSNK